MQLAQLLAVQQQFAVALGGVVQPTAKAVNIVLPVCLLAVSVLFLIGDSYNPFLYFRF